MRSNRLGRTVNTSNQNPNLTWIRSLHSNLTNRIELEKEIELKRKREWTRNGVISESNKFFVWFRIQFFLFEFYFYIRLNQLCFAFSLIHFAFVRNCIIIRVQIWRLDVNSNSINRIKTLTWTNSEFNSKWI